MKIIGRAQTSIVSDEVWIDSIPNNVLFKDFAKRICARLNIANTGRHYTIEDDMYKPYTMENY